jgi:hypothetical protein
VAGFDPCKVESVAALPYALTFWTYWQRDDAEYMAELRREDERIDEALMVTQGFISGTKPVVARAHALQFRTRKPLEQATREELSRAADELWARHESARNRPVS